MWSFWNRFLSQFFPSVSRNPVLSVWQELLRSKPDSVAWLLLQAKVPDTSRAEGGTWLLAPKSGLAAPFEQKCVFLLCCSGLGAREFQPGTETRG